MLQEQYYIGMIFEGSYPPEAAIWCNMNNAYIDKIAEGKYEIKENQGPSEDELKERIRAIRKSYLASLDYTQVLDAPFTDEERAVYAEYRQYLRDYTTEEEWWLSEPLTYEEWIERE